MTSNYFCCGTNPWDDVFGSANTDTGIPKEVQSWNDPFTPAAQPQPYNTDEGRYDSDVRSVGNSVGTRSIGTVESQYHHSVGARSAGTSGSQYNSVDSRSSDRKSRLEGKTLRDIEREEAAQKKALQLQENLGLASAPSTEEVLKKLREGKKKPPPTTPLEKIEASRLAKEKLHQKRQNIKMNAMAESSRPKKELTPEDVRDPETIPGMKCQVDITKENEAKQQALSMISDDYYKHDKKAGIAVYSVYDLSKRSPTNGKKIGAIV